MQRPPPCSAFLRPRLAAPSGQFGPLALTAPYSIMEHGKARRKHTAEKVMLDREEKDEDNLEAWFSTCSAVHKKLTDAHERHGHTSPTGKNLIFMARWHMLRASRHRGARIDAALRVRACAHVDEQHC